MSKATVPSYQDAVAPPLSDKSPQQQMVTIMQPSPIMVGPTPMAMSCPHCHATITTIVETEANTKTHLFALVLCLIGCCPCCLIPYFMDSCQSKKHLCPSCKAYLGTYTTTIEI